MTELLRRKRQCSDLSFSGIAQIPLGYKKNRPGKGRGFVESAKEKR